MQIREVRVWNSFRNDELMGKYRQKIIHPIDDFYGKDLLISLPMNEDNNYIHNHVVLANPEVQREADIYEFSYQSSNTYEIDQSTGEIAETFILLICPIGTFLTANNRCTQQPIKQFSTTVIPIFKEDQNQIVWRFSPDNSIIEDETNWDHIDVAWKVHDNTISSVFSSNDSKSLEIGQLALREESTYFITVKYTATQSQVYKEEVLKFVPISCRYFVANGSDAFSYYHKEPQMPGT